MEVRHVQADNRQAIHSFVSFRILGVHERGAIVNVNVQPWYWGPGAGVDGRTVKVNNGTERLSKLTEKKLKIYLTDFHGQENLIAS
jgi:hypothetical protein